MMNAGGLSKMQLIDFVTSLPAEEKDIFLILLEETGSIPAAVRGTMLVLADSEPKLARRLEEPVEDWLKIYKPIILGNDSGLAYETVNPGIVSFELE